MGTELGHAALLAMTSRSAGSNGNPVGKLLKAATVGRQASGDSDGIADRSWFAETPHRPSRSLQDALEAEIGGRDDLAVAARHRPFDDTREQGERRKMQLARLPLRDK